MLVAVQSFGSIWTARCARTATEGTNLARRGAYYNTTGVLAGDVLRNRSCIYGHVRVDECSGFHPQFAERFIHRVFESEGVTVRERTQQALPPANSPGGHAARCLPVPDPPGRRGMARPRWRLEVRRGAGGLVQRRQRTTGNPDCLAAVWMGAWHAGNVLRGAAARSAMDGGAIARGEVRPA